MSRIDPDKLKKLWHRANPSIISAVSSDDTDSVLDKFRITEKLSLAHLMAQISHETNGASVLEENLNYSAEGLIRTWPRHFNQMNASEYAHHPQKIADHAYDGRNGNRPGTDDGWNYQGRGATMTTGRENYERLGKTTGLDLVEHPELVIDPANFMLCGIADFVQCGCLPYSLPSDEHPRGDIYMVTRRLNGGEIGLQSREAWFAAWRVAIGA